MPTPESHRLEFRTHRDTGKGAPGRSSLSQLSFFFVLCFSYRTDRFAASAILTSPRQLLDNGLTLVLEFHGNDSDCPLILLNHRFVDHVEFREPRDVGGKKESAVPEAEARHFG